MTDTVGRITPWSSPKGGILDPEDIQKQQLEEAGDAVEVALEAYRTALNNWEMGKATVRVEMEERYGRTGEKRSESYIGAQVKLAEKSQPLSVLKEAYHTARKEKERAERKDRLAFAFCSIEKSRSYRKRM